LIYSSLTSVIPKRYVDNKNTPANKIAKNKTLDKRNPPHLTVSRAPSGDEGPTVYIQTKERRKKQKNKNNLFQVQIIVPVGCQIFAIYQKSKNTFRLM
jgi:hypothetical protein